MTQLDPDFEALLGATSEKPSAASSKHDPSAGGGKLAIYPFQTGINTPQWLDRTLAGAGQGMTDLVRHAGNLVNLESNEDLQRAKATDAPLLNTTGGRAGQFIGQTAALAPLGMGVGAGLGRLGAVGARLAANPIASGAIQGAAQGGLMADPGQRLQGTLTGGLAGAALPGAAAGIGKLAHGVSRTPEAQALLDRGVDLSIGQMNPRGMANRMEQAAEGAFGVGDLIQNTRERAMGQYSRAMVEDAMPPGQKLVGASNDFNQFIDEAAQKFDTAYDAAKGFPVGPKIMRVQGGDTPLSTALADVAKKPRIGLAADDRASWGQQLNDQLKEVVKTAKSTGGMQSDHLLAFRSAIRDAIRGESGADNASRAAKSFLKDAEGKVTQALESQLPPDVASGLRATDQQYARFSIMRDAAKAAKDAPGGPTPFQISSAIAKATEGNTYARGGGLGRDLSKAARETFQNNVPRTGLSGVGRLGLGAAVLGPLGLAHPMALTAPLGAAALDLTKVGRRLAAGNTGIQQAGQRGLSALSGAIPQQIQNLPGLYGRSALMGLLAPRLQQMPIGAQ